MSPAGEAMYAVWLYGSYARGDCDALSDLDVFVAGSAPPETFDALVPTAPTPSVSQYSWEEVEAMAGYGSLFLHHLDEEQAEALLGRMGRAAKRMALVNDLVRNAAGFALAITL